MAIISFEKRVRRCRILCVIFIGLVGRLSGLSRQRSRGVNLTGDNACCEYRSMQIVYSAPLPGLRSVTFAEPMGQVVVLSSKKPVVVLLKKVLSEGIERYDGSGMRPVDEGGDGLRVQDVDESKHEFDDVSDAKKFARAQHNPDRNPVETQILEFRNQKWEVVEHLSTSA